MCFRLPNDCNLEGLTRLLGERYPLKIEDPVSRGWRLYETFDWRLYKQAMVIRATGNSYELLKLSGDSHLRSEVDGARPRFAWDFPEGKLRNAVAPILQERSLLPLAEFNTEETTIRILNEDEKTVARLVCTTTHLEQADDELPAALYVAVQPLRGYGKHARRLVEDLSFGEAITSVDEAMYTAALAAGGQTPNSYSGELTVKLEPAMRADQATKAIMCQQLEIMRANEAGISADLDTEFLHDYRVALRRTRSALSQIRHVFPEERVERYKRGLRALGALTGELRDLDVYLLAEPTFRAMLPEVLRADIAPLFELLRQERALAFERVAAGLRDKHYEQLLSDLESFVREVEESEPAAANAATPIVELARERIYRRYRRVVKDGEYILEHTEDELLHNLRLECKRLRYLLEFFVPLFPSAEMRRMIKQLKVLQENLGTFSDLVVQQMFLLAMTEKMDVDEAQGRRALVATGFLLEALHRQEHEVKKDFAGTFKQFASDRHRRRYRKLFAKKRGRA